MALTKIPRGLLDTGIADSSDATAITIDSSENVAIANGSLAVGQATFSGSSVLADFHGSGSGVGAQLAFANDHNTDKFYVGLEGNTTGDGFLYQQKDADINFYTNNTFRAKIDNSGNVGIGTTSPNIFSFSGATNHVGIQASGTNQWGLLTIAGTGTGAAGISLGSGSVRHALVSSANGSDLVFYTNASNSGTSLTERMRIISAGRVGLGGQTAPKEVLNVAGAGLFEGDHSTGVNAMNAGTGVLVHASGSVGYITATSSGSNNRDLQIRALNAGAANAGQLTLHYTGASTFTGPAAATLTVKSTDGNASTPGPHLILRRDSASPANGDDVGEITWIGKNNAAEDVTLGLIRMWNTTVTDGAERSSLGIYDKQTNAGTTGVLFADSTKIHLNHSGVDRPIQIRGTGTQYSRIAGHSWAMSLETTTSDGSDNYGVGLDGGSGAGSSGRGAGLWCYGNEHSSHPGRIVGQMGATGDFLMYGGSGGDLLFRMTYGGSTGLEKSSSRFIVGASHSTGSLYNTGTVNGIGIYGANAYSSCGAHIETATDADSGWAPFYVNKFDWASGDDARWMSFAVNGYNTDYGTINYDGTNFAIVNYSDYRLKENIVDYSGGLAKLEELKVRTFNKKEGVSKHITQQGFIAHEAATANIPGFIGGEKDAMKVDETGETVPAYQTVNKEALIPYLVSAIQELSAKVKELESK